MYTPYAHRGVTAVEVLVGTSIAAMILVAAAYTISTFINTARDVSEQTEALYLAEDGIELVRFVRDNDWTNISSLSEGDDHYLDPTSSGVTVVGTPEVIGMYTRSFTLENVERDGSDDIVASGTEDVGTKYLTVSVSWGSSGDVVALSTLLTDFHE